MENHIKKINIILDLNIITQYVNMNMVVLKDRKICFIQQHCKKIFS